MSLRTRSIAVLVAVLWLGWFVVGSFFSDAAEGRLVAARSSGLRLGLDLQGGVHIVIGPDLTVATEHELSAIEDGIQRRLEGREGDERDLRARTGRELRIRPPTPADAAAVRKVTEDDGRFDAARGRQRPRAHADGPLGGRECASAPWTRRSRSLRRRIDDPQTGIPDSVVTRQGADRVLVQIPGGQIDRRARTAARRSRASSSSRSCGTRRRARSCCARSTRTGCRRTPRSPSSASKETDRVLARVPACRAAPTSPATTSRTRTCGFDNAQRAAEVTFTFNSEGGRIFGDAHRRRTSASRSRSCSTTASTARRTSATAIGGRARSRAASRSQEAADLAVVLRAGSLPIPVAIEEERTVGPGARRGLDPRAASARRCVGLRARRRRSRSCTTGCPACTRASR